MVIPTRRKMVKPRCLKISGSNGAAAAATAVVATAVVATAAATAVVATAAEVVAFWCSAWQ